MLKKYKFFYLLVSAVITTLFLYLYTINPVSLKKFNNTIIDMLFHIRGDKKASKDIIIIDIDEKSLKALGHWPWRRDKIAKIVDTLTKDGVGVIGFDMVFAEKDERSPSSIAYDLGIDRSDLKDYDAIFAQSIQNSPSILGFVMNMEQNFTNIEPQVNAIFIQRGKKNSDFIPKAKGVTANIESLQKSAYSSGSFNMFPDSDGVVRFVPMLFDLNGVIYPSLSLEMIRVALQEKFVYINYSDLGVESIQIGDLTIPTDRYGRLFVNYKGEGGSYEYISALDIYNDSVKASKIEGKIALLGTSAAGLLDLRATPFDTNIAGVEIHANAIDNIINKDFLQEPSNEIGLNYLLIVILPLLATLFLFIDAVLLSILIETLFIASILYLFYFMLFSRGMLLNYIYPLLSLIVTVVTIYLIKLFVESKQKERILDKFSTKVSDAVAQTLLKSKDVDLAGEEREITIFFSDIRNFTTISESFGDPKRLIAYLNRYMSPMSEIIIKNRGTIDKYIGDAIMAYWNAPLRVERHADLALKTALEQLRWLEHLNRELETEGLARIDIGIGIHTGLAVVGEMGSHTRSDYTIIGDSVNTASRIEGLCKEFNAKILISEDVKMQLKDEYIFEIVGEISLKGKSSKVMIYKVLGEGNVKG